MINTSTESIIRTTSFNQPSSKQKRFPILLSILFGIIAGLFLIVVIILAILFGHEKNKTIRYSTTPVEIPVNDTNNLCLSPYCIKAANYFLESIDESVEPCENFYQFSCGNWIKNAKIPEDANSHNTFEIMQLEINNDIIDLLSSPISNETIKPNAIVNARRLFSSCINEEAIEEEGIDVILSFINTELGGWPILQGSTWDSSTFDLTNLLTKLGQYSVFTLYYVGTYPDEKNSSSYCIYMGQGSLGLSARSYYINETEITQAYRQYMKNIALALTNDTSIIDNDINDIFEFEKTISQYFWTPAEQYDQIQDRTNFSNLSSTMNTTFNFTDYLQRIYRFGNVSLIDTDIVTLTELAMLRNVSMIIDQQSSRTIQNYLIWRFMMNMIESMPKKFRNIKQEFKKIYDGITSQKPRSIKCATFVTRNMGLAVSKLYIGKHFDKTAHKESTEMIQYIRNIFTDMINQSVWMDSISKNVAMEKIRVMSQRIGYPDGLDSDNITDLEKIYEEYNFNSSYIQNVFTIIRLAAKHKFQILREPINRKAWTHLNPTDVNANYRPWFNDITLTAAILRSPFFNKDAPKYLNYGGIGMVIGHEFTHGFDSTGRQFDKDGNRIPWWTNETINAFNEQKKCVIEQYNNYTVAQIDMKINGEQTQDENIADNGGLKEAFLAYEKWAQTNPNIDKKLPGLAKYSTEQMFFLNFGKIWCSKSKDQSEKNDLLINVHSPGEFRVIGSISNLVEFDRVFGCKPGQGNSRINKCLVW
ncbi:unnamed protein product [Adineta steineri]|uniref:Uncharacterized protein n=1 Tax=Adineta steineri TaxID=433720 RepID=A0A813S531_9BILA|nr:unnamed protein product [Adineta steineri]